VSDRTEAPTPRRLRRAREEGDSGSSSYAAQAAAFAVAVALAPSLVRAVAARASGSLGPALARAAHPGGPVGIDPAEAATTLAILVLPLLVAVGAVSAVAQLVQTGGVVTGKRLTPKLDRLDPVAGFGRLLTAARVASVARALLVGALVGWLAYAALAAHLVDVARVTARPARIGDVAASVSLGLAWQVAFIGLAFGALDLAVMRRAWLGRLKMSKAEVRREQRDAEGDPHLKAARARAHQEVLVQATLASVRQASVVVVNPTHLACALRYDEKEGDDAPVVVASGEGELAARIVQAAREAGVPVVRDVPLARALIELEVGVAIPEALYQAVAEILREVWEDDGR
jgi:flagellar biosynthesis protein FlhB